MDCLTLPWFGGNVGFTGHAFPPREIPPVRYLLNGDGKAIFASGSQQCDSSTQMLQCRIFMFLAVHGHLAHRRQAS